MAKLYVARCTKRYTDYGDLPGTEEGIVWCDKDGYYQQGWFESKSLEQIVADFQDAPAGIQLVILPPKTINVEMNPRGDI